MPAGDQGASRGRSRERCARRGVARGSSSRPRGRATPASLSTPSSDPRSLRDSAARNSMARAAIWRRDFGKAGGDQRVPAFRIERPAPPGVEVPLPGRVPAASSAAAQGEARDHPVRRLEHRAQGDRSQELAQQPEEFRLPARGARMADAAYSTNWASSTCSAAINQRARAVHVVVESRARRGRRTSAGASTTRSPRRASPPRRKAVSIYKNRRFSDHAPLIIDYDCTLS